MPNRVEREIEEILTKLDEFVPDEPARTKVKTRPSPRRAVLPTRRPSPVQRFRQMSGRLTGGHIVLGAAVGLIVAMFLRAVLPGVATGITIICLVIIGGAIVLSIRGNRRERTTYWRGQPVTLHRHGPFTRLRMWWRRRNQRR